MRTTVTLDADVEALIERVMRERGMSFKEAINQAVRNGLRPAVAVPPIRTLRLGGAQPGIDLHMATRLAAELEDDEVARKLEVRK